MDNKSVSEVAWFQRAKSAVKAAATKVVAVLSRAKSAVLAKVEPVLKTRTVRVMRTIGRWATIILGAVAAVSALFAAPFMALLVGAAVGMAWLVWRFGVLWLGASAVEAVFGLDAAIRYLLTCRWLQNAFFVAGKVLFGLVATWVFCVIVAACSMTPWGIVDFALAFWLLWTIEAENDATTPTERAAAASSYRTARTAQVVAEVVRSRQAVA